MTETKNIEIEIRGPLTAKDYSKLVKFFQKNGRFVTKKERILIDYSTEGLEDRTRDIRLRVTNKVPEIVVKLGKMGGNEARKELSVLAQFGDFDKLVQIFAALGLTKGVLCLRKSQVFMYREIEFTLVEVPDHSYYFEAEKLIAADEDKDAAQKEISGVCRDLGLNLFDNEGLFAYIEKLNKEANEIFDFENYTENYFKNRFKL
jgi:predicted adenylyl cyclase CyaB